MVKKEMARLKIRNGAQLLYVDEKHYEETMLDIVEPELKRMREEFDLQVTDGSIHMENYILQEPSGVLVMLHGFTESAEKLRELVWYFVQSGFSVFTYDERGHGRSVRLVEDESITHVQVFNDYVDDLRQVVEKVVRKAYPTEKLCLLGHSMGGAVAAQYLIAHPETFERAVLTSPMIVPSGGQVPVWVGQALSGFMLRIGKGKERAFIGRPYNAETETFEDSCSTSESRFRYYWKKRSQHRYLQNTSPTYRWAYEAIRQSHRLLKQEEAAKVQAKVLLCQAKLDDVVLLPPQDRFVALLTNARIEKFNGKHELYNSVDEVMRPYVQTIIGFLSEKE